MIKIANIIDFLKLLFFSSFIDCSKNMYGKNCSIPCGHCFNSEQCHHINGTCMNGCDSGYKGFNCTEGDL